MIGAGRYDALCTQIREQVEDADAVIVMIFHREPGKSGFSMQAKSLESQYKLPQALRLLAAEIERGLKRAHGNQNN